MNDACADCDCGRCISWCSDVALVVDARDSGRWVLCADMAVFDRCREAMLCICCGRCTVVNNGIRTCDDANVEAGEETKVYVECYTPIQAAA